MESLVEWRIDRWIPREQRARNLCDGKWNEERERAAVAAVSFANVVRRRLHPPLVSFGSLHPPAGLAGFLCVSCLFPKGHHC